MRRRISRAAALRGMFAGWRVPAPDAEFFCSVCKRVLRGATVTLDEQSRATCSDCTGRDRPERD